MYADKDSNSNVSLMEMTSNEVYVLTEALVRYYTNPDIPVGNRIVAKNIACEISNNNIKYMSHGNEFQHK